MLARKYRPRSFDDLIGQEAMVRTLTNAFATGRIPQAYMLTGVRGVGKTTTARILARALNYETAGRSAPARPSTCRARRALPGDHREPAMSTCIEMDAASHTGIDDIREIIDGVRYAPVSARYKVYIIDEVHMLSKQAFNGLLKTLEEPPPHVKFIFATTEIRKVPVTVLSRCQRFDLRRIDAGDADRRISPASAGQGRRRAPSRGAGADRPRRRRLGARRAVDARPGDRAWRPARSTPRPCAACSALPTAPASSTCSSTVMRGDAAAALAELRDQYDTGADPAVILTDLAEFTHLVTRLKLVPDGRRRSRR